MWEDEVIESQTFRKSTKLILWGATIYVSAGQIISFAVYNMVFERTVSYPWEYLEQIEIIAQASAVSSLGFSMMADSFTGRITTMSIFLFVVMVPLMAVALSDTFCARSVSTSTLLLFIGVSTTPLYHVITPLDRAIASQQIKPHSPQLRKYYFMMFYFSSIIQLIFGLLLFAPHFLPWEHVKNHRSGYTWFIFTVQACLWAMMLITYAGFVCTKTREESIKEHLAAKVIGCLHFAAFRIIIYLLRRLRNRDADLPAHPFDGCNAWFSDEVVEASKKIFKLFLLHFSLTYFHGSETILTLISYKLDYGMKNTRYTSLPLALVFLVLLLVMFPFAEYCIIPLTKKLGIFTDLRMVGVASILFGLSYLIASVVETLILLDTEEAVTSEKYLIRVFNFLSFPVMWFTLTNSGRADVLHIPSTKSRLYISALGNTGPFESNFSYPGYQLSFKTNVQLGQAKHLMLKNDEIYPIDELDVEMRTLPKMDTQRLSIFCSVLLPQNDLDRINQLSLIAVSHSGDSHLQRLDKQVNVTKIHIPSDMYNISLNLEGVKNETITVITDKYMKPYALYFIVLYGFSNGSFSTEITEVRSGFSYSQFISWPHLALAALAISLGKISINIYTYQHSPQHLLATSFSLHSFTSGLAVLIFTGLRKVAGSSFAGTSAIALVILIFSFLFIYVSMQDDFQIDEEQEVPEERTQANIVSD